MPTYAYRWADGTMSVCSAEDKDEAMMLFDEIGPVSRRLIIKLRSPLIMTMKPDLDRGWVFDEQPLGEQIALEALEKCFPHYDSAVSLWKKEGLIELATDEERKKMEQALLQDQEEIRKKIEQTPQTPDIIVLFPEGLPGQNN